MTPGGAQESHPKVVVPLGHASGRGDRWQHGRWGHPPHNTINLPEGKDFQRGAKEDREAFRGEARR